MFLRIRYSVTQYFLSFYYAHLLRHVCRLFLNHYFFIVFQGQVTSKKLEQALYFFNVYLFLFYFFGWYHAFVYRNKIPIKNQSVSSIILISCSNMIVNLERPIMVYVPSTLHQKMEAKNYLMLLFICNACRYCLKIFVYFNILWLFH